MPENTKTGQRIVVSLPEAYTCYENIKSFSKYTKENDYVFTNYDGTSMKNWTKTYKSKLEEWQLYLDDEGNPRPPYSLRHYYATQRLLDSVQVKNNFYSDDKELLQVCAKSVENILNKSKSKISRIDKSTQNIIPFMSYVNGTLLEVFKDIQIISDYFRLVSWNYTLCAEEVIVTTKYSDKIIF